MKDTFTVDIIKAGFLEGEIHKVPLQNVNCWLRFGQKTSFIHPMAEIDPKDFLCVMANTLGKPAHATARI
jgi:hypothetical protein